MIVEGVHVEQQLGRLTLLSMYVHDLTRLWELLGQLDEGHSPKWATQLQGNQVKYPPRDPAPSQLASSYAFLYKEAAISITPFRYDVLKKAALNISAAQLRSFVRQLTDQPESVMTGDKLSGMWNGLADYTSRATVNTIRLQQQVLPGTSQ